MVHILDSECWKSNSIGEVDFVIDGVESVLRFFPHKFTINDYNVILWSYQIDTNQLGLTTSNVATLSGSQTLTNKTFTAPNLNSFTLTGTNSSLNIGAGGIVFEGSSDDAHETTLIAQEPGQDNTITIPDSDLTLVTTATHATRASHITQVIALG